MNSFAIAFGLLVLVAYVYAQKPTPCTSPPQWEARMFGYDTVRNDTIRARIAYDSVYKRERIIEEFILGTDDESYDVLYLHNANIEYRFNLKTRECKSQPLTRPWRDFGIPQNATFRGESYIGSSAIPTANLLVTIWTDKFVDPKGEEVDYMGVWTYEACIPISSVFRSQSSDSHNNFYDITPGIDNPNVFVPRKECL